jgi:hypothetical protein
MIGYMFAYFSLSLKQLSVVKRNTHATTASSGHFAYGVVKVMPPV